MKSQNQFENLMNQYGSEAAAERERHEKKARQRQMMKGLRRVFFLLLLLGGAAYGYLHRAEIDQQLTKLKMTTTAELKTNREANAKAKVGEVNKMGQKRAKDVEDAIAAKN